MQDEAPAAGNERRGRVLARCHRVAATVRVQDVTRKEFAVFPRQSCRTLPLCWE